MRHAITFLQSSFMITCTIVEYSLPLPWSFSWNIISSLHIVFLLCASVGWCDVCTEFTNLICHHWILNVQYLRNNWQLCMSCVYFVKKKKKSVDWDWNCSFDLIYFQHLGVYTHWFSPMCLILLLAYMRNWWIFIGKSKALLSQLAIWLLSWWFYFSSVWWLHKY